MSNTKSTERQQEELKEDFDDKAQRFIQIEKVWNFADKPSGYMLNFQYIFKSKKKALKMSDVIEKQLRSKSQ